MALIAEPGMGYDRFSCHRLLEELRDSARTVFLFQTQCDSREFFRYIHSELGIKTARMGLVSMHNKLNEILFSEMLAGGVLCWSLMRRKISRDLFWKRSGCSPILRPPTQN